MLNLPAFNQVLSPTTDTQTASLALVLQDPKNQTLIPGPTGSTRQLGNSLHSANNAKIAMLTANGPLEKFKENIKISYIYSQFYHFWCSEFLSEKPDFHLVQEYPLSFS